MGANSGIEWTDHTFNPWIGCQKVSPACTHCYAEVDSPARVSRKIGLELWGPETTGAKRRVVSEANWRLPVKWNKQGIALGRQRVFCASQSDVFEDYRGIVVNHKGMAMGKGVKSGRWITEGEPIAADAEGKAEGIADLTLGDIRCRLFALVEATPRLDWLLLTKRPENVMKMVPDSWRSKFPDNVWMGTTVESQEYADERIPHLLGIPARIRFLSVEPMLGEIDMRCFPNNDCSAIEETCCPWGGLECKAVASCQANSGNGVKIHWVIAGGESGRDARPTQVEWVRSLRDQCEHANVPFFFKQWGEWCPFTEIPDLSMGNPVIDIESCKMDSIGAVSYHRIGKKLAGRTLDGKLYSEVPT